VPGGSSRAARGAGHDVPAERKRESGGKRSFLIPKNDWIILIFHEAI